MTATRTNPESGTALIMALMLLALLASMLVGYFTLTHLQLSTTRSTMDSVDGLYAAEAGLNLRADGVRAIFQGYSRPSGTSPEEADPCTTGNMGDGDMGCVEYALEHKVATTYIVEEPENPDIIVIPRGELYQNLNAQEYGYAVESTARDTAGHANAILSLKFQSRLVPLFQFAAFYDKDLEILPGPAMVLEGPVHVNGDLYLNSLASLDIEGQVTTSGDLYRGRKDTDTCGGGAVRVADPDDQTELPACGGVRTLLNQSDLDDWNGMIETHVDVVTVPPPEVLDPVPGSVYWDEADIRIMLNLNGTPAIEVRNPGGSVNVADSATLAGCGAAGRTGGASGLYNYREGGVRMEMLEINVRSLLDCLHNTNLLDGVDIDESSQGGLVWYFGVDGPNSDTVNNYGVRLKNGGDLSSTAVGAPEIRGLTVVTNQAAYVQGNYNSSDKKPAAVMADSLNVLSNNWNDANSHLAIGSRIATSTVINAAFLGGTDSTGGIEGPGGPDDPTLYNGGLENYPRFHENWGGASPKTLTYRGSFVSLDTPRHVDGLWSAQSYAPPIRDWRYDTDFNDAAKLPPLSPRFVYLRQQLFQRQFGL